MNEIVKYHNDLNQITLKNLNSKEINLFFSVLFKMKNMGSDEISIPFLELKSLSDESENNKNFIKSIETLNFKLLSLNQKIFLKDERVLMFNLFTQFSINLEKKHLKISLNNNFFYLLNNFIDNLTEFELKKMITLKSKYSKNIFRLLIVYFKEGEKTYDLLELREKLYIPESYGISNIEDRILKVSINELNKYFINLKYFKIKVNSKIKKIKFVWSDFK